ncbi:hypothetical protein HPB49_004502 [Dermacentor silvarum]|uniref:Uncharacterized protein n=1 Tax=Dermacentor silvarum TaxID=543639 RepID=A0ACB8DUE0_DERSI|nr:hypothetical protein HPB49_004502 [Dermacentor silvarum]
MPGHAAPYNGLTIQVCNFHGALVDVPVVLRGTPQLFHCIPSEVAVTRFPNGVIYEVVQSSPVYHIVPQHVPIQAIPRQRFIAVPVFLAAVQGQPQSLAPTPIYQAPMVARVSPAIPSQYMGVPNAAAVPLSPIHVSADAEAVAQTPVMTPRRPAAQATKKPSEWTVNEVAEFIRSIPGCARYVQEFHEYKIDGEALLLLSEHYFISVMNFSYGAAIKMRSAIKWLQWKEKEAPVASELTLSRRAVQPITTVGESEVPVHERRPSTPLNIAGPSSCDDGELPVRNRGLSMDCAGDKLLDPPEPHLGISQQPLAERATIRYALREVSLKEAQATGIAETVIIKDLIVPPKCPYHTNKIAQTKAQKKLFPGSSAENIAGSDQASLLTPPSDIDDSAAVGILSSFADSSALASLDPSPATSRRGTRWRRIAISQEVKSATSHTQYCNRLRPIVKRVSGNSCCGYQGTREFEAMRLLMPPPENFYTGAPPIAPQHNFSLTRTILSPFFHILRSYTTSG